MEEQARKGAQDVLQTAERFGGTGINGVAGQGGGAALGDPTGVPGGEWALGGGKFGAGSETADWAAPAADDLKLSYMNGEAAPAGEAVMNMGGLADSSVDAATAAADQAGQTVADLGTQAYTDMVADRGANMATEAATDAASAAASAGPIAGTALNIGSNLAQGNYGAAAGAGAGAAIGSVIPGLGTALGGTIGGLLGSFF